jgi:Ribosomal protein L11 methyltransferase (PrmA)
LSLIVDEHREYLADHVRVSAFRRAIQEMVHPGDVAIDLGAGTGILGLLACRAGAKRVYAIDEGGIVQLTREVAQANDVHDRLSVLKGLSTRLTLPEPADIVIADQIGRFGFEAGILEYFSDARRRFLKPNGRAVPSRVDLWVAPVEQAAMWERITFWSRKPAEFEFAPARIIAVNTGYPARLLRSHLLGKPVSAVSLDTLTHGAKPINFSVTSAATRAGTLHGIGGWFSARLSPHVQMTNSPLARQRINRQNVFFPIEQPIRVSRGDEVTIAFSILPGEVLVTWSVEIRSRPKRNRRCKTIARYTHSTAKGMLISREDLMHTNPDSRPVLSPWGKARQTVLELCNGTRRLRDIEQEVRQRHADLFPSLAEAATFTAEVLTRYTQ